MRIEVPNRSRVFEALAIAAVLVACGCARRTGQVHIAEAGPETWIVDGVPYRLSSTHYERGPSNMVVYVMRYPSPRGTSSSIDREGAGILAWPIVKYAYNNRTFERARIAPLEGSTPPSVLLAVDVLSPGGDRLLFRHEVPVGR